MHELSIAQALIEAAGEAAGAARVTRVRVRVGALSGVAPEALRFSFDVAAAGTACEGAELEIDCIELAVRCPVCRQEKVPAEPYLLICPDCGSSAPRLRGRELELVELELVDHDPAHC